MSFDALCNQSMSFHSNRFGGTLVSQTSKFMSAYQLLLETITFPFLPVICSVIFTCAILAPRVPIYVAILMALLVVYACVSYYMYKRILSLNEKAASAQNQLSGELSDSVANILAVKTSGREDYERALFDQANRQVVERDSKRMWASLGPRHHHRVHHRGHHERGCRVHCRRKRLVRHQRRHARDDVHLHLHRHEPVQFHQQRPAALQPRLRRCQRHDANP